MAYKGGGKSPPQGIFAAAPRGQTLRDRKTPGRGAIAPKPDRRLIWDAERMLRSQRWKRP